MIKIKGLGKGLSALIGDSAQVDNKEISNLKTEKVPIHYLYPNKFQPRKSFDKKLLDDLASSIKNRGIIQPVAVRKISENKFEIIAGERRWRAAQIAQLHEIPIVILDASDELAAEFAVLENVQREGLNAVEEASGYQLLIDKFGYTQEKIAEMIGKSRVYIANTVRLTKLPKSIQEMIINGLISPGHARALIDIPNSESLAKDIVNKNLTVRQAEFLAKKQSGSKESDSKFKRVDPNIKDLENSLASKTGMNVTIDNKKNNSGKITFAYKNIEQFTKLTDLIKQKF